MICKICGQMIADDATFCPICGAAVETQPVSFEVAEEVPASDPGKTLGLIAMIVGIVAAALSCVCACSCLSMTVPPLFAVAAMVLGFIGMKKSKAAGFKNPRALVGLITGGGALGVTVCYYAVYIICYVIIGGVSILDAF
ncbi:MAG: zinc-ribbon domain-containing protein [Clostridia bacterium]|nr:zinc-ribbon domain-containing protein [Clostridia bacterium]